MPSFEYEFYTCPKCKERLTVKTCPKCRIKTKGQGKVSMRFRLVEDGKKKNKRTGWYMTKREAEEEYLEIKSAAPKIDLRTRDGVSYLFEDLLEAHLAENALSVRPGTAYEKRMTFKKHILPYFKNMDVRNISKQNLMDWQTSLFSKTYKNGRISNKHGKKVRGFLNTFLNWIYEYYEIPNLLKLIKAPKNNDLVIRKEILEIQEFMKLDKVSEDNIFWNTMFNFMFHTGMRPGEVRAFAEADYYNGEVTINKTISRAEKGKFKVGATKNSKEYSKPIDNRLIAKLDKFIKWKRENNIPDNFLFTLDGNFISKNALARALKRYMDKTDIDKNITPHCFRHSYVSMLIDMDCSTKTVAEMIGDTEEVVMQTYSHLYHSKKRQIVDKLNNYLGTDTGTILI